jgi:hypothetical protein
MKLFFIFYILLFAGFFVLIFYHIYNNNIIETFEIKENAYRLGDIVRHIAKGDHYLNLHKGTIGYEYNLLTNKKNDYTTLKKICDNRKGILKDLPKNNELIVHVRLGDVIEKSKYTVDEHLNKELISIGQTISSGRIYIKSKSFFYKILNKIKNSPIDTIVFIGGDHRELASLKKSNEYLEKISNIFKNEGYKVIIKFNKNTADEDFIYLSNAKYFVPTGGGFSKIIMEIVKLNNNVVYGEKYLSSDRLD